MKAAILRRYFKGAMLTGWLWRAIFAVMLLAAAGSAFAQESAPKVTAAESKAVVEKIASMLAENYVFPEAAKQSGDYLKKRLKDGAYNQIGDPLAFAEQLTGDLQSVNKDKHMRVRVLPAEVAAQEREDPLIANLKQLRRNASNNRGFRQLQIFDGNVGYLDLRGFPPAFIAREKAASAMHFLEDADAIIFDLRQNGGGNPDLIQYICSYFFEHPTHLNSIYRRKGDRTEEFWTLERVEGKKRPEVPVFILTSDFTFSGGEEFAYNFKTRQRATLIGETTGGGANPGGMFPVNERFGIFIPTGRAINPVTGVNWEGVGVEPDIKVPAEQALDIALEKAREAAEAYRQTQEAQQIALLKGLRDDLDRAGELLAKNQQAEAEALANAALKRGLDADLLNEMNINLLGYDYLQRKAYPAAIAVFKFNAAQYPRSSNVYDSLGEAYMENGDKALAVENYQKSLELDPQNRNAREMLARLGAPVNN